MKTLPEVGEQLIYEKIITIDDLASFQGNVVHEVYSTFALARDAEYAGRLILLKHKKEEEEGVGTMIEINHKSVAFKGSKVIFKVTVAESNENDLLCHFSAYVNGRLIAEGKTGQKSMLKSEIENRFNKFR